MPNRQQSKQEKRSMILRAIARLKVLAEHDAPGLLIRNEVRLLAKVVGLKIVGRKPSHKSRRIDPLNN